MRDPKRIDPIIDALRNTWKEHTDMRLCQLLHNIVSSVAPEMHAKDQFFVEDDIVQEGLGLADAP